MNGSANLSKQIHDDDSSFNKKRKRPEEEEEDSTFEASFRQEMGGSSFRFQSDSSSLRTSSAFDDAMDLFAYFSDSLPESKEMLSFQSSFIDDIHPPKPTKKFMKSTKASSSIFSENMAFDIKDFNSMSEQLFEESILFKQQTQIQCTFESDLISELMNITASSTSEINSN